MRFAPEKLVSHLPEGDYSGTIMESNVSADQNYLWLKIRVDNKNNSLLNISIPFNSVLLNNFAMFFVDEKTGEVDTDDFVDYAITFSLKDRTVGNTVYSKFVALSPVFDD